MCALVKEEHAGICDENEYEESEPQAQRLIVIIHVRNEELN